MSQSAQTNIHIAAYTQALVLSWEPALRFYTRRTELLRALEDKQPFHSFSVTEESVGVRPSPHETVLVDGNSLRLTVAGPDTSRTAISDYAALVLDIVAPPEIRHVTLALQHLGDLQDADYTAARRAAFGAVFSDSVNDLAPTDFAVLLDGTPTSYRGTFQMEFGVLAQNEIPARLARSVGRMAGPRAGERLAQPPGTVLPSVAFFADSMWARSGGITADALEWVDFWDSSLRECGETLRKLWQPAYEGLQAMSTVDDEI